MELVMNSLRANNPLGYLAALGILVATRKAGGRLAWSGQPVRKAVLTRVGAESDLETDILDALEALRQSNSLTSQVDGIDKLKVPPKKIREYLATSVLDTPEESPVLATSLIAEGSYDRKGEVSKPSDLYFAAAKQSFLQNAREILDAVNKERLLPSLTGHWKYDKDVKSMGWDVRDNREHAYMAHDPTRKSVAPKLTNPEIEALALLGLTLYPVFGSLNKTLTTGCSGRWKGGKFSWPIWERPLNLAVVETLVTQVHSVNGRIDSRRYDKLKGWGVADVYESEISRSDQGGYGAFRPARVL